MDLAAKLQFALTVIRWANERNIIFQDLEMLLELLSTTDASNSYLLLNKLMAWCNEREVDIDELPSLMALLGTNAEPPHASVSALSTSQTAPSARGGRHDSVPIKHNYRVLRAGLNLTTHATAERSGVSQTVVSSVERKGIGGFASRKSIELLNKFYKLPPPD